MGESKPNYYAILPADVRYDPDLKPSEKLLFAEITALSNKEGYCWSRNAYFADLYGVTKTSVSNWITALVEKGYIERKMILRENSEQIEKRILTPVKKTLEGGTQEKFKAPHKENFKGNTTRVNNTRKETPFKFDSDSQPIKLAGKLRNLISRNIPKQTVPDNDIKSLQEWAEEIQRLYKEGPPEGNEGFSWEEIETIIEYSQDSDFWKTNIRSAQKLREKAMTLFLQAEQGNDSEVETESSIDWDLIESTGG